jgi:hypothetical protein
MYGCWNWHVCHCNIHRGTEGTWITWWGLLNHFDLIIFIDDWSSEPLRAPAAKYAWALQSISVCDCPRWANNKIQIKCQAYKKSYITLNQFANTFLSNFDDAKLNIDKSIKTVRELNEVLRRNLVKYLKKSSTKKASPTTSFVSDWGNESSNSNIDVWHNHLGNYISRADVELEENWWRWVSDLISR